MVHRGDGIIETVNTTGAQNQFLSDVDLDQVQSTLAAQMDK